MGEFPIHVVVASDDNYFRGLITTVYSMLQHSKYASKITVHILDGGITSNHKALMECAIKPFKATIEFIAIDQNLFKHLAPWHGTGKMAYARLLSPDLFPQVNHIIYSDIDILWRIDVADLWKLRSDKFSLQYVRDSSRPFWQDHDEDKWLNEHSLQLNRNKYFCSGMLLINLERFRRYKIHHSVLNLLHATNGSATFPDQTALNIVFSDRNDTKELDPKWQTSSSDKTLLANGLNVVLHYAGDCPWNPLRQTDHLLSDLHILWHQTYANIVGITTWQSLRFNNSPMMILCARVLYLGICHLPPFKGLISLYLRLRHKDYKFLDSVFRIKMR